MSKKTPNVTLQGVTVGTICAAITALFTYFFHKSMPVALVGFLPVVVGALAHYFGFNLAMVRAAKKELEADQQA